MPKQSCSLRSKVFLYVSGSVLLLSSCGYHVSGTTNNLPATIHSIAVPAFTNASNQYKVSTYLADAVTREMITRTKYKISADVLNADAVLTGGVLNYIYYPTTYDQATGRASAAQAIVFLRVTLTERATGKVLFTRPNMQVRENFEISVDPKAFFDESPSAMKRLSEGVARSVVSAILEGF